MTEIERVILKNCLEWHLEKAKENREAGTMDGHRSCDRHMAEAKLLKERLKNG